MTTINILELAGTAAAVVACLFLAYQHGALKEARFWGAMLERLIRVMEADIDKTDESTENTDVTVYGDDG